MNQEEEGYPQEKGPVGTQGGGSSVPQRANCGWRYVMVNVQLWPDIEQREIFGSEWLELRVSVWMVLATALYLRLFVEPRQNQGCTMDPVACQVLGVTGAGLPNKELSNNSVNG
jgi:hypothetical protein